METADTLVCARWIVPVDGDRPVLEDHAVVVRSGRIVALLPQADARAQYVADEVVDDLLAHVAGDLGDVLGLHRGDVRRRRPVPEPVAQSLD